MSPPSSAPPDPSLYCPFSLSELASAWEHVAENDGCAGADGISVEAYSHRIPGALQGLLDRIRAGSYRPLPLLRIEVEKFPGAVKTRTLLIPAVQDRILQTAATRRLTPLLEEEFLDSSFAYRPRRGVFAAMARVRQWHERGYGFGVHADIAHFFDSVSHKLLLDRLQAETAAADLLPLLQPWIQATYWDGNRIRYLRKGIPQGSPLSPALANFVLSPLDAQLEAQPGRALIRYADDLLVLASEAANSASIIDGLRKSLQSIGLELSPEKTRVVSFEEGFHFLGAWFTGFQIYQPWHDGASKKGRLIGKARPIPARLLRSFLDSRRGRTPAHKTLAHSPATTVPPPKGPPNTVAFLYLTEQGAIVRKSGDRLLIEKESRIDLDLPYHKLENILVFGNIQLTAAAMVEMLDHGIVMSLFSRQGRYRGSLRPPSGKNVLLRVGQVELFRDDARSLALARSVVHGKIANGRAVLARYHHARPHDALPALLESLHSAASSSSAAPNAAVLLGIEGNAAAGYFSGLMSFQDAFPWPGRHKHPATDPLNALLSWTYTLLMSELAGLIEAHGLDPEIGFYHEIDYGRPSLALDLLEAFRHPVADRLVLTLFNRRILTLDDFESHDTQAGVFLTHSGMKRFFQEYEQWMLARPGAARSTPSIASAKNDLTPSATPDVDLPRPSFRDLLRREVEALAACLREGTDFQPFRFDRPATGPSEPWNTSSVTI